MRVGVFDNQFIDRVARIHGGLAKLNLNKTLNEIPGFN